MTEGRQHQVSDLKLWGLQGMDGGLISSRPEADFTFKEFRTVVLAELEQAVQQDPTLLEDKVLDIQRAASARTEVPSSVLSAIRRNLIIL